MLGKSEHNIQNIKQNEKSCFLVLCIRNRNKTEMTKVSLMIILHLLEQHLQNDYRVSDPGHMI